MLNNILLNNPAASGDKLYVEDVFSTYLYTGNGGTLPIDNGIALGNGPRNGTVLQLGGDGTASAQNNTFLDSSANNFTITRFGNTTQGSFSPYGNNWSNSFDGDGDSLTYTGGSSLAFGTGDFTIELWAFLIDTGVYTPFVRPDSAGTFVEFGYDFSTGSLKLDSRAAAILSVTTALPTKQWVHIAASRSGTSLRLFVNGTQVGTTTTNSTNFASPTGTIRIGGSSLTTTHTANGYFADFRVVNGTAVYTANFAPPSAPLTAIPNTSLLICQSNRFRDASTNNFAITRNGNVSVREFSPYFRTAGYDAATEGASAYFDGTGDYLGLPSNAAISPGNGAFTLDFWFYPNSFVGNTGDGDTIWITSGAGGLQIGCDANTANWGIASNGVAWRLQTSTFPTNGAWNHIAIVRSGTGANQTAIFLNGTRVAQGTVADTFATGTTNVGSANGNAGNTIDGYLSNVRFVKGTAVYDPSQSTISVPTAPVTAITNTQLLLNFANAAIVDSTGLNNLETVGNVTISNSVKKYGTGSIYFDGVGDYLLPNSGGADTFAFGTLNFTIEFWLYLNSVSGLQFIYEGRGAATTPTIYMNGSSLTYFTNSSDRITSTLSTGVWYHVALTRSGTSTRMFVNGMQVGSTYFDSTNYTNTANRPVIGVEAGTTQHFLNGYLDDFRVTKGLARYTSNFTPPTSALPVETFVEGKGGMVWIKNRNGSNFNGLWDTARGAGTGISSTTNKVLSSNTNSAEGIGNNTHYLSAFSSNGFSVTGGTVNPNYRITNTNGDTYASWTFRKAPKFFDVISGTSSGDFSHALGDVPGCIIFKATNGTDAWYVAHRGLSGGINGNLQCYLNSTSSQVNTFSNFDATATKITPNSFVSGTTQWVAYLFAHDETSDGIIRCGSYTGNGNNAGPTINLGWEPQWILIKNASSAASWILFDNMRGMPVGSVDAYSFPNTNNAEASFEFLSPTSTGFQITSVEPQVNTDGNSYIYIAIRRGPMRTPTSAETVFSQTATNAATSSVTITTGFPQDLVMVTKRNVLEGRFLIDKQRGYSKYIFTSATNAEATDTSFPLEFTNVGFRNGSFGVGTNTIYYAFRRAPSFFDIVCYSGDGTNGRSLSHNLGATPELVIVKDRNAGGSFAWLVGHKDITTSQDLQLRSANAVGSLGVNAFPTSLSGYTSTSFIVNQAGLSGAVNGSGNTYVAYLFASCPGVSKVGSYTGNGSSQTINCNFSNGARFVMIKRTNASGDWYVWDTARGIVAGNDPHLSLNIDDPETTSNDSIDPDSTGFVVNQVAATNVNVSGATYIYLAIA